MGADGCYGSFEEILDDPEIDAVHLVTPIPLHEEQMVQVLEACRHCACTVPMAISLEGIRGITEAVRKTGKKYMMMETTLYTSISFSTSDTCSNRGYSAGSNFCEAPIIRI